MRVYSAVRYFAKRKELSISAWLKSWKRKDIRCSYHKEMA